MTRRLTFSAGHRYWDSDLSKDENQKLYGKWASPYNHGHNYGLDVEVIGEVSPRTGMVVNIKVIDDIIRRSVLRFFDNRSINDEVPGFDKRPPCIENILKFISEQVTAEVLPRECTLTRLRLEELPVLYGELDLETKMLTLTRVYEFAASHRLDSPHLTTDENLAIFGKCNNPMGHGHNYTLEVTVTGTPDPLTGMLCSLEVLDEAVNKQVVDRYDHKNLNVDLEEFADGMTTSEIVAAKIFDRLLGQLPADLYSIKLHETARNIFEVRASG